MTSYNIDSLPAELQAEARQLCKDNNYQTSESTDSILLFTDTSAISKIIPARAMSYGYFKQQIKDSLPPSSTKYQCMPHLLDYTVVLTGFGKQRALKQFYKDLCIGMSARVQQVQIIPELLSCLSRPRTLIIVYQPHLLLKLLSVLQDQQQEQLYQSVYSVSLLNLIAQIQNLPASLMREMLENPQMRPSPLENTKVQISKVPRDPRGIKFQTAPAKYQAYRLPDHRPEILELLKRGFITFSEPGYELLLPKSSTNKYVATIDNLCIGEPISRSTLQAAFPASVYISVENVQSVQDFRNFILNRVRSEKVDQFLQYVRYIPFSNIQLINPILQKRLFVVYTKGTGQINARTVFWLVLSFIYSYGRWNCFFLFTM
ncbi:Conserved_hypothetical protein [Hexamita inflata]|uniref:Uncharacterized protein n=1 Tax=Hexamita inflata TaxID=28002 RepID=A0AA86RFZ2_9EUKA|nr:Conserved hypothetical protein [Hexamita inflata]